MWRHLLRYLLSFIALAGNPFKYLHLRFGFLMFPCVDLQPGKQSAPSRFLWKWHHSRSGAVPKKIFGANILNLSEQQYLVWDTESWSTKQQDMSEIWRAWPLLPTLVTPMKQTKGQHYHSLFCYCKIQLRTMKTLSYRRRTAFTILSPCLRRALMSLSIWWSCFSFAFRQGWYFRL